MTAGLWSFLVVTTLSQAAGDPSAPLREPVAIATRQSQENPRKVTSLLVNGSFEEAPATRRFVNVAAGASSVRGWVVTGEGIDIVAALYWPASDGVVSVDLDGSAGSRISPPYAQGGVAQTFRTTPGTRYLVTFDMAGNPARPPATKPMRIFAAGQEAELTFDITGKTMRNMGWSPKSWTFTAKSDSTTLEFRSLTVSPLTGFGPAIDNVSVVALDGPAQLEVTENEKEIRAKLGAELLFDTGKFTLRPAATAALDKLALLIRGNPGLPILIEGHTDSVGTREANRILSLNRANAVKEWLTSKGEVASSRISVRGHGSTMPVAPNQTAEGRQKNRRVEVRLQKAPAGE